MTKSNLAIQRLGFLLLTLVISNQAQGVPSRNTLITLNRPANELRDPVLYDLDMYGNRQPDSMYRYPPQDIDHNEISLMPDDDYISGDLEYGDNKSPDVMMEQIYPGNYIAKNRNKTFKKILLDTLDDNDIDIPADGVKKRVLSSFRERIETEKSKNQRAKIPEQYLRKFEDDEEEKNSEISYDANMKYMETLRELWNKYKNSQQSTYLNQRFEPKVYEMSEIMRKKQLSEYPSLGWSGVGYRKRESPANYILANEALYRSRVDDNDRLRARRYERIKSNQHGYDSFDEIEPHSLYNQDYMYAKHKRNIVTKRSSNYFMSPSPSITHHKRYANKEQYRKKFIKKDNPSGTDPKIVKDLKNIFGTKDSNKTEVHFEKKFNKTVKKTEKAEAMQSENVKATTVMKAIAEHNPDESAKNKRTQEQEVNYQKKSDAEHLNIKKKSLDWSNYFGYDRRKKSRHNLNDIDNDWIIEHYNKAFISATKKSTNYPLKFFRNYDELNGIPAESDNGEQTKKKKSELQNSNESKLSEMDVKLKNIEDLVIDEALKYTGAHEGTTDSKEIQEIKDKVISRLAAAYSLEKMRRALGEFKTSIAAQRYAMKLNQDSDKDSELEPDTRLGKNKRDKLYEKPGPKDNKFQKKNKQDYKSENDLDPEENQGTDLINSVVSGIDDYEILERRCQSVSQSVASEEQSDFFYPLCKWHQICYLCTQDDSQEELTNCDVMFLSKAYVLCQGDMVCQWAARPAVEYLRDTYESTESTQSFDKSMCQTDTPYNSDYINHLGFKIRR